MIKIGYQEIKEITSASGLHSEAILALLGSLPIRESAEGTGRQPSRVIELGLRIDDSLVGAVCGKIGRKRFLALIASVLKEYRAKYPQVLHWLEENQYQPRLLHLLEGPADLERAGCSANSYRDRLLRELRKPR